MSTSLKTRSFIFRVQERSSYFRRILTCDAGRNGEDSFRNRCRLILAAKRECCSQIGVQEENGALGLAEDANRVAFIDGDENAFVQNGVAVRIEQYDDWWFRNCGRSSTMVLASATVASATSAFPTMTLLTGRSSFSTRVIHIDPHHLTVLGAGDAHGQTRGSRRGANGEADAPGSRKCASEFSSAMSRTEVA